MPVPYVDSGAAARLFRHKVLRLLLDADLIDEERVEMILGWRHTSGFSVHNEVVVQADDGDGLERLARYLARPPVSLQRMEWDRETREVLYRTGRGHGHLSLGHCLPPFCSHHRGVMAVVPDGVLPGLG